MENSKLKPEILMPHFVFLPGTLCDERVWKFQTQEFTDNIVVNLRIQNTQEAMLDAVKAVQAKRFILVGFSMGGHIAQEFALAYPERVSHVISIASSSEGYPKEEKEVSIKAKEFIKKGLFKGITDRRLKEFLHPKAYENQELRNLIHSMSGEDAAQVYLGQLDATLERRDLSKEIGSLKMPFIAIGGEDDKIVSKESILRIKDHNSAADIHIVSECGHFVPLEKPEVVNGILRSLL